MQLPTAGEAPSGPSPEVKVPVLGTGGNKTPDPQPCARGASVVRGTCVLSQGSVALGKESFESGTRCKPDIWARSRRRAGDTWAGGFPGGGRSPRRGPGAGPRLACCESWAARWLERREPGCGAGGQAGRAGPCGPRREPRGAELGRDVWRPAGAGAERPPRRLCRLGDDVTVARTTWRWRKGQILDYHFKFVVNTYNLQFTPLKCTIQWDEMHSQCCAPIFNSRTLHPEKETPSPSAAPPSP